jgi:hypothetical protein
LRRANEIADPTSRPKGDEGDDRTDGDGDQSQGQAHTRDHPALMLDMLRYGVMTDPPNQASGPSGDIQVRSAPPTRPCVAPKGLWAADRWGTSAFEAERQAGTDTDLSRTYRLTTRLALSFLGEM